jgi:hypothetical protein
MSTLTSYASASARDSAAPASSNTGLCIFRTDTKAIEVSDGTDYLAYNYDGISSQYSANSYSGLFDGIGDYAIGSVSALNGNSGFSFSLWFKYGGSGSRAFFGTTAWSNGWFCTLDNNEATITYGFKGQYATFTLPTISSSTWYHLALVHDDTSVTLYLDKSALSTITGKPSANQTWVGNNINLGRFGYSSGSYFNGHIDEVAVFGRALTSSEVSDIYSDKVYTSPAAVWRLENDATDEIGTNDLTNNGVTFDASVKPY